MRFLKFMAIILFIICLDYSLNFDSNFTSKSSSIFFSRINAEYTESAESSPVYVPASDPIPELIPTITPLPLPTVPVIPTSIPSDTIKDIPEGFFDKMNETEEIAKEEYTWTYYIDAGEIEVIMKKLEILNNRGALNNEEGFCIDIFNGLKQLKESKKNAECTIGGYRWTVKSNIASMENSDWNQMGCTITIYGPDKGIVDHLGDVIEEYISDQGVTTDSINSGVCHFVTYMTPYGAELIVTTLFDYAKNKPGNGDVTKLGETIHNLLSTGDAQNATYKGCVYTIEKTGEQIKLIMQGDKKENLEDVQKELETLTNGNIIPECIMMGVPCE